jgi:Flp pilus assembly protein TadB
MAERSEIRQGVRDMLSPEEANERLEHAVSERPLARHLLDLKIVVRAVLIAAVLTIVCAFFSLVLAAVVLVVAFFASWILLASRSYEKRRPTQPVVREGERVEAGDRGTD